MGKKCSPGVICIENATLLFIVILCAIAGYLAYSAQARTTSSLYSRNQNQNNAQQPTQVHIQPPSHYDMMMRPMDGRDVLLDPHTPPMNLGYTHSAMPPMHPAVPSGRMAVNVATSGSMRSNYTQVGILTPPGGGGGGNILALMGRQLHTSRQKWQYYTISDSNNSVKLPVSRGGRSCTGEHGCDEISGGDTVYVEGYNQAFNVTMYDNDGMSYIPYL
jgi:hypothetical protein